VRIGTKMLLFGSHNIIVHSFFTLLGWIVFFRSLPSIKEFVCIVLHDIGYWGCEKIDGGDGDEHPYRGALIAARLFGNKYYDLCIFHSATIARFHDRHVSKLYYADKMGWLLMPNWLLYFFVRVSGEIEFYKEYKMHRIAGGFRVKNFKNHIRENLEREEFRPIV